MSKHGKMEFVNGILTWVPTAGGQSTTSTTTPPKTTGNAYLDSIGVGAAPSSTSTSTPYTPLIPSPFDFLATIRAEAAARAATAVAAGGIPSSPPPDWRCYYRGDLNPQLNRFTFNDILANTALARTVSNPMSLYGEAIRRLIRPDITRHSKSRGIIAVVLGGKVVEGQEALSYNLNIESLTAGASANRLQMLYVRVPELTDLSDPYCSYNSFAPEQIKALVEMHTEAAVPNWVATQPAIIPGTLVEVEFIEGFSRAIVKNILEEATDLQSMIQAIGASAALSTLGAGVFLGPPIKAAEGAPEFVELMRASPHLKDYSNAMLAALASNAQHESGFIVNANGDPVAGYAGISNPVTKERVEKSALDSKCSHGFWQMNVCAVNGGGRRFAAHFNLDVVTQKKELVAAFQNPQKQFEVIDIEMRALFGGDVVSGTQTAEYYAGRISDEYERCKSCLKKATPPTQWLSRQRVAMDIYNTITTTAPPAATT